MILKTSGQFRHFVQAYPLSWEARAIEINHVNIKTK